MQNVGKTRWRFKIKKDCALKSSSLAEKQRSGDGKSHTGRVRIGYREAKDEEF